MFQRIFILFGYSRITTILLKATVLLGMRIMNEYMNRIALQTFSYFDTGDRASGLSNVLSRVCFRLC